MLQYLSLSHRCLVWRYFHVGTWMRTTNTHASPSELVVAHALRNVFPEFLLNLPRGHSLAKFLRRYLDLTKCPGSKIAS